MGEIYPPSYYSFASGEEEEPGLVHRLKQRLDLRSYRNTAGRLRVTAPRILDVGGGTGEISGAFVRRAAAASAFVVDPDPASIEVARKAGLEGFAGTIEELQTDERFDLVLMLNLIEHVADPVAVLEKAARLLEPDGLIWLQTPNFRALDGQLFRHRNWAGYHCPRHWTLFGERGVRRALGRAGLEPVEFRRTQGGTFWAQSLVGLRRDRQMRAAEATRSSAGREALRKPLVRYRSFPPLAAAFASMDICTRRWREVSQVAVLARVRGYTAG